jgi:hypothetical protein
MEKRSSSTNRQKIIDTLKRAMSPAIAVEELIKERGRPKIATERTYGKVSREFRVTLHPDLEDGGIGLNA